MITKIYQALTNLVMNTKLICCLIFFIPLGTFSQSNIDSLFGIWNDKTQDDTTRLKAMQFISWNGYLFTKPDSAYILAAQMLEFANKTNQQQYYAAALNTQGASFVITGELDSALIYFKKNLLYNLNVIQDSSRAASILSNIGITFHNKGEPDSALFYFDKSIELYLANDDEKNAASTLTSKGVVLKERGDYKSAINIYFESLEISERFNDSSSIATNLANIGVIRKIQKDYDAALKYYTKSYNILEKQKNYRSLAMVSSNIGSIYKETGDYDKAFEKYYKANEYFKKIGDQLAVGKGLNTIAYAQHDLGQISEAVNNYKEALSIARALQSSDLISAVCINLGRLYYEQNNHNEAIKHGKEAISLARELESEFRIKDASNLLYDIYKSQGKDKLALEMHELYIQTRDSLESEENQRAVIQQEYKYQYEKQAALDSLANLEKEKLAKQELDKQKAVSDKQKAEIKQKRTQQYALFGGLGLLFIFTGFVYNRFRVTRKQKGIIENQKSEVETQRDIAHEQKEEAERQKHIVEEKNQEIMDSITYAKRLQEAILPPPRLVKEWLTDSFLFYKPKDIVAGDFYWMETVDTEIDGRKKTLIFFAAADCTGHGVPGAMVSVVCANALNRSVKEFQLKEPGQVLDKVTELVIESFEQSDHEVKDGMDIALCALDISAKKLYYAGANNPLWIITETHDASENKYINQAGTHELIEYKATKQPVGKYEGQKQFETLEIQLKPGDAMYIFSDGFADQFGGEKGKKYKYANFKRFLLSNYDKQMDDQKSALESEFMNWKRDLEQIDDVCVIGVRVNGKERNNFTARELEVLEHLKEGLPSKLIADKMGISPHTVDTYRRRLLAKTGTYNATELINYCVDKEVI